MPAQRVGPAHLRPDPLLASLLVHVWFDVTLVATLRAVQLGDRVGAKLEHAVLHTLALVFAAADRALHHQMRPLAESTSIFGEFAERHDSMPLRAALPLTIGILPRLFGRDRERGDERAVWR